MKRAPLVLVAFLGTLGASGGAQTGAAKPLDIYVIDTEGGKATLFVAPSGESLLIDTGNPGGRDTDRIMLAIAEAGLKQLDYVLSTHYHVDHIGGMEELSTRIPIRHFVDHGPTVEEREQVAGFQKTYAELYGKARHTVVKPGDRVPIAGLDWRVVTSAGRTLAGPLAGGGIPNPACAQFAPRENTRDPENGQSLGSVIAHGRFRAIDLGDLLWNNEADLMCPTNKVGPVDLYLVSHHGLDSSGSAALVHGVRPRVAVMQNGTRKGGSVQAYEIMRSSPRLEDIWQSHWSYNGAIEHNPAGVFIANVDEPAAIANVLLNPPGSRGSGPPQPAPQAPAPSAAAQQPSTPPPAAQAPAPGRGAAAAAHTPAYWIKISATTDGSFTVTNARNGFSKTYPATAR